MSQDSKQLTINISTSTVLKTIGILMALGVLYLLRDVALIIIVSIILATSLNPWVNALQRRKVPRIVATLFIYFDLYYYFIQLRYFVRRGNGWAIHAGVADSSKQCPSWC